MGLLLSVLFVVMDAVRWIVGRAGAFLGLLVIAGFGNLAWHLLPPYVEYHRFRDEVVALAAASTSDDGRVRGSILRAAEGRRIALREDQLEVRLEGNERTVRCGYEVPVKLLPRLQPQVLRFSLHVVQPAFVRENAAATQD
jgi:hypothetical protein